MKLYHLEIITEGDTDLKTETIDKNCHPYKVANVGVQLNNWPLDDFMEFYPIFCMTERLMSILSFKEIPGIKFSKIKRVEKGPDFNNNYGQYTLPKLYQVELSNDFYSNPITLHQRMNIVVNEIGLNLLRENHVFHAKSTEIPGAVNEFFKAQKNVRQNDAKKYYQ